MKVQVKCLNMLVGHFGTPSRWVSMNFYRNFIFLHFSPKNRKHIKCFCLVLLPWGFSKLETFWYGYVCSGSSPDANGCILKSSRGSVIQGERVGNFPLHSIEGLLPPLICTTHCRKSWLLPNKLGIIVVSTWVSFLLLASCAVHKCKLKNSLLH